MLLFDEPLSNLDANLRRSMRDKIRELQKQFDITSLYVTHDQSEAFAVSDTVLVMNKGHIMQIGSPQDLYRQPASRFMASFMGDANLFPATFSDQYVDIYGYHLPRPLHFDTQGEGMVGVRPEAITLSDRGEESQRCVIRHVAYMGPSMKSRWNGTGRRSYCRSTLRVYSRTSASSIISKSIRTACLFWRMQHNVLWLCRPDKALMPPSGNA